MQMNIKKMLFVVLLLVSFLSLSRLFAANTIKVPDDYSTIQAAINAAVSGDTISVAEGTYKEPITVNKVTLHGLTIEGAGAQKTFLNLSTIGGTAVTFQNVSGVTLRGFTIRKADVGIRADKSKANITNNLFVANAKAFENHSSYSRITNNTFYGNTGTVFTNSSSTLKNNIVSWGGRYGVVGSKVGSVAYNLFHGNTLGNFSGTSAPPAAFYNITGNPLFVNLTSDFHLKSGSPAIKTGDPLLKNSFNNMTSDIGVYGGPKADKIPAKVKGVSVASATNKVTVSWNKNIAYNIADHKVYYGTLLGNYTSSYSSGNGSSLVFKEYTAPTLEKNKRYYFSVRALDGNGHEGLDSAEVFGAIDNTKPPAPQGLEADIGDRRLYLSWNAVNDAESGTKGYKIYWDTTSGTYGNSIDVGGNTSYELSGLTNGTLYYIAVSAYDNAGNEGTKSAEVTQSPEEIRGIMGLKNTGGCFIATAAYGSYEERHVKVLREFRDRYLLTNTLGRVFVSCYYSISPPVADFIRDSETLKFVVRSALLPLIGFAWMLINYPMAFPGLAAILAGVIVYRLWVIGFKPIAYHLSPITRYLTILFVLALPAVSSGSERSGLSFSLSYGQLEPASDDWKDIYGDKRVSNYRASIGYRLHPTLGVEIGGGYLTKEGKGKTLTGRDTVVGTIFQSAPVDFTLFYRLNYFREQFIIPYVGGGLSYNFYWERVKDGREIKGGMWGHHTTGGIQLLLDRLDKKSARDLEEDYGIDNTYLALTATHSVVNDFGKEDVDLGGWNYFAGLVFEF